jgi:hypothetical protein
MAPRSRTGKLMQGLFGRFGKKYPQQPAVSAPNSRYDRPQSQTEIDDREFPSANRFDDDEETNWDDAETLADENSPIVYAQPIVPVVAPLPLNTIPDLEEWDEALPAATVKNSNIQEVRRSKKAPVSTTPTPQDEDVWDENIPSRNFSASSGADPTPVKSSQIDRAIGLWTVTLRQFRRVLPSPLRQLSDAILTVLVVLLVTVSIWIVDGLFVPGVDPVVANQPTVVGTNPADVVAGANGSPEQAFIEAIQGQLSDFTSQYSDDIIQTLSIDIVGRASPVENRNLLIVQLNPSWYQISDDKQDRVIDKMWLQAKANKFSKLEIRDSQGVSIARSPVVGNHPIILQRRQVN